MMTENIKLPFGLDENNILVHIADVVSGEKCNCVCPSCHSKLVAAKGRKIQHHFRHAVDSECKAGLESAIHLAAKRMIMEKKQITLPEFVPPTPSIIDSRGIKHAIEPEVVVQDGTIITFNSVQEELELHGMKADILAIAGGKQLMIEIFYRHKVEDEKIEKIKDAKISAIEIKLSDLAPKDVQNWETFWSCINDVKRVQWLHNVKGNDIVYPKLENKLKAKVTEIEKEYKQEEIIKYKREQQEKIRKQMQEKKEKQALLPALEALKILCSDEHVAQLSQEAEMHPAWKLLSKDYELTLNELQFFLNVNVPDGNWIFGCDRRIWQTAIYYNYFVSLKNDKDYFSIKQVDDWLKYTTKCKVPRCAETVGRYGKRYPTLVPADVSNNLPSSWRTLRAYFNHLCELGMLEYSGKDLRHKGSCWFEIIGKMPDIGSLQNSTTGA